jgi:hypothetical protein
MIDHQRVADERVTIGHAAAGRLPTNRLPSIDGQQAVHQPREDTSCSNGRPARH